MLKTRWYRIVHEPQTRSCLKVKIFKFLQKGFMMKVMIYCPANLLCSPSHLLTIYVGGAAETMWTDKCLTVVRYYLTLRMGVVS